MWHRYNGLVGLRCARNARAASLRDTPARLRALLLTMPHVRYRAGGLDLQPASSRLAGWTTIEEGRHALSQPGGGRWRPPITAVGSANTASCATSRAAAWAPS